MIYRCEDCTRERDFKIKPVLAICKHCLGVMKPKKEEAKVKRNIEINPRIKFYDISLDCDYELNLSKVVYGTDY